MTQYPDFDPRLTLKPRRSTAILFFVAAFALFGLGIGMVLFGVPG